MNQILSVGTNNKNGKSGTSSILRVFAIFLIIFGVCMASSGAYSFYTSLTNDNSNSGNGVKPVISIEKVDSNHIKVIVNHDKALTSVSYTINDGNEVKINTNNLNEVEENIELPAGTSKISIKAKDKNNVEAFYESTFEVQAGPNIELEKVENSIKITVTSSSNIDYVKYYWDDDEANATTYTINDIKNETLIDVLEGQHTLNIESADIDGNISTKSQKIIGDKKPELQVTTNGQSFIIRASDDEELTKIEITLNSNDTIVKSLDGETYSELVSLDSSYDVNKIIVTVYNKNGISTTVKVKH